MWRSAAQFALLCTSGAPSACPAERSKAGRETQGTGFNCFTGTFWRRGAGISDAPECSGDAKPHRRRSDPYHRDSARKCRPSPRFGNFSPPGCVTSLNPRNSAPTRRGDCHVHGYLRRQSGICCGTGNCLGCAAADLISAVPTCAGRGRADASPRPATDCLPAQPMPSRPATRQPQA
jgi:hypothetical protein